MKVGDKVEYIKRSDKQQTWTGVVLFIDTKLGIVTVDWKGTRSGRQVFQTNPIAEVKPATVEAK